MKVTIENMLKMEENQNKSILQMKRILNEEKKKGKIFFKEDVHSLELTEEFELYFYVQPSKQSKLNAFPIKKEWYHLLPKDEKERNTELENYFKRYYGFSNPYPITEYKTYINGSFVWMYRE